jgi:hypothetical protein
MQSNMQEVVSVCLSHSEATVCRYFVVQNVLRLYISQFLEQIGALVLYLCVECLRYKCCKNVTTSAVDRY